MKITAEQVKQLREQTGAPMMECKRALEEAKGNVEEAYTVLRKRGQAAAAKRSGRATKEGLVGSYIHAGGKIGVIVEVNCESDFVARNAEFQELAHDVAMHIAATAPCFIRKEEISEEILAREQDVLSIAGGEERQARRSRRAHGRGKIGQVLRRELPL